MKILYFGTVCDIKNYERLLDKCRNKPTLATVVFETSLLKGFGNEEIDIFSFPMIPTFPQSPYLGWGPTKEVLEDGKRIIWLQTLNFPFFKQITRRLHGRQIIKKWLERNKDDDCAILTYSVPPFLVFQHDLSQADGSVHAILLGKEAHKLLGIFRPVFIFGFPQVKAAPGAINHKGCASQSGKGGDIVLSCYIDDHHSNNQQHRDCAV